MDAEGPYSSPSGETLPGGVAGCKPVASGTVGSSPTSPTTQEQRRSGAMLASFVAAYGSRRK